MKSKTPEICFEGFEGEWDNMLLGEVLEIWSATPFTKLGVSFANQLD